MSEHNIKTYNTDKFILETLKRELPEEYAETSNLVNAESQTETIILSSIAIQVGISEEEDHLTDRLLDKDNEYNDVNDYDMDFMDGMSETDEYVDTVIFSDNETMSTTSDTGSVKVRKKTENKENTSMRPVRKRLYRHTKMSPCRVLCERLTKSFIRKQTTISNRPQIDRLSTEQQIDITEKPTSRTKSPEKTLKLLCPICAFSAENRTSLNKHIKMLHTMIKDETCCSKFFPTRWDTFLHLIENHKGCENKFTNLSFSKQLTKQLKLYVHKESEEESTLRVKYPKVRNKILDLEEVKGKLKVKNFTMQEDVEAEYSSQEEAFDTDDNNSIPDLNPVVSNVRSITKNESDSELEDVENLFSDEDDDDEADHIEKAQVQGDFVSSQQTISNFKFTQDISSKPTELEGPSQKYPEINNGSKSMNIPLEMPNLCDIKTEEGAASPRKFTTIIHDNEFMSEFMLEDNDPEGDSKPHSLWANGCVYFCKVCKEMSFDDYSAFFKHLKIHRINGLLAYKKKYGNPYSVLNYIQCKICDEKVLQDYNKISTHLRKNHKKYSVSSYYEEFVETKCEAIVTAIEEAPKLPQLVDYNDSDSSDIPLDANTGDIRVSIDSLLSPEGSISSQLFDSSIDDQCPNRDESYLVESKNLLTYKDWVDKCNIICKSESCEYKTRDVIDFKMHIISEHGEIFEDYCDTNGLEPTDPWSESKSITCKLCESIVTNNYPDVENHMKKCHQISGFTYYMENIQI